MEYPVVGGSACGPRDREESVPYGTPADDTGSVHMVRSLRPAGVVGTRNEGDMKRHTALRRLLAAAILTGACAPAFPPVVRARPELGRTGPVAFYVPGAGAPRAVLERWCGPVGAAVVVPTRSAAIDVERITSEPD